jgi:Ser-tRNA(Ala) deacylase AlaX
LNILEIPDWTVCCVPVTDFCKKTGEIGGVKLLKFNHRPQKSELEIVFDVTEAAVRFSIFVAGVCIDTI